MEDCAGSHLDTDVIVVLVGVFHRMLQSQPLADIWVAFGVGRTYKLYSINAICNSLGASKFTGTANVSRSVWV